MVCIALVPAAVELVVASTFYATSRDVLPSVARFNHASSAVNNCECRGSSASYLGARLIVERDASGEKLGVVAVVALGEAHEFEIALPVFVVLPAREAKHSLPRLVQARNRVE